MIKIGLFSDGWGVGLIQSKANAPHEHFVKAASFPWSKEANPLGSAGKYLYTLEMFGHEMWAGCWMSQPLLLLQHQARMSQQEATQQHSATVSKENVTALQKAQSQVNDTRTWLLHVAAEETTNWLLLTTEEYFVIGSVEKSLSCEGTILLWDAAQWHWHTSGQEEQAAHDPSMGLWESSAGRQHWPALISHILAAMTLPPSVLGSANCFAARR